MAGVWGVHVPSVKAHYDLDAQALSMVLFVLAVGSVLCLTQAGRWVTRLGARRAATLAGTAMGATLAAMLASPWLPLLLATAFSFGVACALFDVSINAEGNAIEAASGTLVMSGFHGMFSAGGMLGAALAAAAIARGVPAAWQLVATGASAVALALVAAAQMLPAHAPPAAAGVTPSRWPRALIVLGVLAAVGLLAEGAIYDWSVLYLSSEAGAPPALAALGFASFSAAMAATRFAGDTLRRRFAAPHLLAASAALASAAMTLLLIARDPWIGLAGFALAGVGFANVVPILFAGASRVPGVAPARGIAAVSSLGYAGLVIGPPLVGTIAQASSLTWGMGVIAAGAALLAWGARHVPR